MMNKVVTETEKAIAIQLDASRETTKYMVGGIIKDIKSELKKTQSSSKNETPNLISKLVFLLSIIGVISLLNLIVNMVLLFR